MSPSERGGHEIFFGFFGDDQPSSRHDVIIKDVQAKGKYDEPQYRYFRGLQIPIYKPPKGLAIMHKTRGESEWSVWFRVPLHFVSNMVQLLGQKEELFVALHECKFERKRWVRSIELKTTNPDEE